MNRLSPLPSPLSPLFCLLLLLAGCPKADSDANKKPAARLEGVTLRLAVADDPALAAAVERVKGEWNAQTGSELEVVKTTEKDLLRADRLPADAVLCRSRLLADLAEKGRLAPVPKPILHDPQWAGVFPLLKLREAVWANQTMAVPFGSPVFCCYYRADLLEKLGRRPPKTWDEYQSLAKLLAADRPAGSGWCGTIEPLASGWAGLVLLARAAPYAKHRNNYSALFDVETMEPLVSGPPFVQALEELVAAAKLGPKDLLQYNPTSVRTAFWNDHCGMALIWPTAAEKVMMEKAAAAAATSGGLRVGFVELPGSPRAFNLTNRLWDRRPDSEDRRVSLISIAGRLGVVAKESANTDAAFQLLLWLSGSQMSPQTSAASPATTLFRQSNLESPGAWVERPIPAPAAVQYADTTEAALSHKQWLGALRLPGASEYLSALDNAVAAAVDGKKSPLEALTEANAKWKEITNRLGIERQKAAYRHSVGLE